MTIKLYKKKRYWNPKKKRSLPAFTTHGLRNVVMKSQQSSNCCFCGIPLTLETATLEHIIPISLGGTDGYHNLTISCQECNSDRGTIYFLDYYLFKCGILKEKPIDKHLAEKKEKRIEYRKVARENGLKTKAFVWEVFYDKITYC